MLLFCIKCFISINKYLFEGTQNFFNFIILYFRHNLMFHGKKLFSRNETLLYNIAVLVTAFYLDGALCDRRPGSN